MIKNLPHAWKRPAALRRMSLLALILFPTYIASGYMAYVLPHGGTTPLEIGVLIVFAILYAWISVGFWTAMVGWVILMRGTGRNAISRICGGNWDEPIAPDARTAIIMPIYNEDVQRVTAGISAIIESLIRTGRGEHFDFFILSDPGDPDIWIREEVAWTALKSRFRDAPVGIYYRQRRSNEKKKSGNVADFCRRWGKNYRYMVVLDADSIMAGQTLVRMVHIMERRPTIGILQTAPKGVNKETLIARVQQFANSVYGAMFAAGLNFWQLGDSQFWGHNAIIRVKPFMEHCALPRLSGNPPLGGDILSHDFVEAALMRRSGYEVWLGYLLEGSYEEPPPTLLDELKRDRRWCQGNMQHMRLIFTRGLYGAHRVLFLNGAMAYGSALLWFLFLAASTIMAIAQKMIEPDYFPTGRSLFPSWPIWEPQWALVLLASTAIILFFPKICSLFYIVVKQRQAHLYGGSPRLVASFLLEVVISTLLAPSRMLFHSKFVFLTLLGRQISWDAQQRKDVGTGWGEAVQFHLGGTIFAFFWGGSLFVLNRSFFWWLSPIIISLLFSIPLSVWLSRREAGLAFRRLGLFLIPEEVVVPDELVSLENRMKEKENPGLLGLENADFIRAVVDPIVYSLHLRILSRRKPTSPIKSARLRALCEKALSSGPQNLDKREKRTILSNPECLAALHRKVWELTDEAGIRAWELPSVTQ